MEDKLRQDLFLAIKEANLVKRDTLRLVLAAIKNAEIERGRPLEGTEALAVIAKEARLRRESIEAFTKGKRPDLVAKEEAELQILQSYLPQPLSQEEIADLALKAIAQIAARGAKDKGKVMAQLMPQVRGRAEGGQVSEMVSRLLAQME